MQLGMVQWIILIAFCAALIVLALAAAAVVSSRSPRRDGEEKPLTPTQATQNPYRRIYTKDAPRRETLFK